MFPAKLITKKLAFLILTYKRDATVEELKRVSDQPAGLIRDLRKDGFVFKDDGKNKNTFLFKNAKGQPCRRNISFRPPKAEIKGKISERTHCCLRRFRIRMRARNTHSMRGDYAAGRASRS
jgi:hypothetical protein